MWRPYEGPGYWSAENTRTWDRTDENFTTLEEAQSWCDRTNQANSERIEQNKRDAVERKAKLAAKGPLADQYFVDPDAH